MNIGRILRQLQISLFLGLTLVLATPWGAVASGPHFSFGDASAKNAACLACHGSKKAVGDRFLIEEKKFGQTTHSRFGCRTCHDTIGAAHPDGTTVGRTTGCMDCHNDIVSEYSRDFHSQKASCAGCHNPHRVYTAEETSAGEMNRQCAGCHKQALVSSSHSRWLPQADLHLGAISCVTCHSKAEGYVITIYLAKRGWEGRSSDPELASHGELQRLAGGEIKNLIDRNRDNYISIGELQLFNQDPAYRHLYLKGMLKPVKPRHAFPTFDNRWDCTFCHGAGPETMQTSFVAFPEDDGRFREVPVERGAVLKALETIPNFYLTGSTRNGILNGVGLMIVAGGMVVPVGHGFFRFLTRKFRK